MKKKKILILWGLLFMSLSPVSQAVKEECNPFLFQTAEQEEQTHRIWWIEKRRDFQTAEQEEQTHRGRGIELRERRKEKVFALIRDNEERDIGRGILVRITGWSEYIIYQIITELIQEQKVIRVFRGPNTFYSVFKKGETPVSREEQKKQRKERVFALIRDSGHITVKDLIKITDWPESRVYQLVAELEQEQKVIRVRKYGIHWMWFLQENTLPAK
ncbi:MAG: hypothetical protein OXB86_07265 [Bdellovibrionales bacterium]|nr:hypothetical protein [Bdellovibrionales bacterium]